jgi:hypothetical protein
MSFNDITVTPISRTVNVCDQWERINDAISDLLDAAKAHVNGSDDVHPASELDNDSGVSGSKIDNALDTLKGDIDNIVAGAVEDNAGWFNVNAGGTANAITGTYSGISALTGIKVALTVASANTDTVTFNLNSLGADTIKYYGLSGDKVELSGSNWVNGATIFLIHDGTDWMLLPNVIADIMAKQDRGEGLTEAFRKWNYLHNTNTHDDLYFQTETNWTSGAGTQSADSTNVLWGDYSLKILENDASAGTLYSDLNGITLDLTKTIDGNTSLNSDFIRLIFYVSDANAVNGNVAFNFSQGASYDGGNRISYVATTVSTGWNYLNIAKSDFSPVGAGVFSGIQSIRLAWKSNAGYQNEYISFQLVQLVRVDPDDSTQYSYFQKQIDNGVYQNTITWAGTEESILGVENNKVRWKLLGTNADINAYTFSKNYSTNDNFIYSSTMITGSATDASRMYFYIDDENYVGVFLEANTITLRKEVSNSITDDSDTLDLDEGQTLNCVIEKTGTAWSLKVEVDGVLQVLDIQPAIADFGSQSGYLVIGGITSNPCYIESATITSTKVANFANVSDIAYRILQPSCRVYNNANISVNDSTATGLTFNSERWDNNNLHDLTVNTGRLTCRKRGIYSISCNVRFASNAVGYRLVYIKINGGSSISSMLTNAVSGVGTRISISTQYELQVNDYVEVEVYQTSGGALNIESNGNYSPEFMMTKISD